MHDSSKEEENYFKILGIDFNSANTLNEKKIDIAVQKWEEKINEQKNCSTKNEEKQECDRQLGKKTDIIAVMKDKKLRNQEASAMRKIQKDKLRDILKIKYQQHNKSAILRVPEIEIRNFEKTYRLSQQDIQEIYKEFVDDHSRFEIIPLQGAQIKTEDYLIQDFKMSSLIDNITKLRKIKSEKYKWASKVKDLYDFACFINGGEDKDIPAYRTKPSSELLSIMDIHYQKIALLMNADAHVIRDILTAGKTNFFNNEKNREKYDRTLSLENLSDLFSTIKNATENLKKDKNFAESCIEKIADVVKDDDLAIAIYNSRAGLKNNPYFRETYSLTLYCHNCGNKQIFATEEEAEKAKCVACKESFYMSCPKCGRKIRAGSKICHYCSFSIADTVRYKDSIRNAEMYIRSHNLRQAESCLATAKAIYPDKPETHACEQKFCNECFSAAEQSLKIGDISSARDCLFAICRFMPENPNAGKIKSLILKEYSRLFKSSLDKMDLNKAQEYLDEISKFPEYSAEISNMSRSLQQKKDLYNKPVEEINKSIASSCYEKAASQIADAYIRYPGIRLESQKRIVDAKMEKAGKMMPSPTMSAKEASNRCVDILREVKDYSPALHYLRNRPPSPVKNLRCFIEDSEKSLYCSISWMPSGDYGASYKILRKENIFPQHPNDGTVIADNLSSLEKQDRNIRNGINYCYAVFSYRAGIYSAAATCQAVFYGGIDGFKAVASAASCSFQWNLPDNCVGVRIFRCENHIPGPEDKDCIISELETSNYFTDKLKTGIRYGYLFQSVYGRPGKWHYGKGISQNISVAEHPEGLTNPSVSVSGGIVSVSWQQSAARQTVVAQQILKPLFQNIKGKIIQESDIKSTFGGMYCLARADSSYRKMSFEISRNAKTDFALLASRGTQYLVCGIFSASSVEKCEIDEERTNILGSALKIRIRKMPQGVGRIYYFTSSCRLDCPYLKGAVNISDSITAEAYRHNDVITIRNINFYDHFYVYLIGEYDIDGEKLLSDPSELRINLY